ncbi:GTPase Der [Phycisphaerae bacterium RAS1]|nr:GTPase Der [Phycisphaerae bacterium RAS1]
MQTPDSPTAGWTARATDSLRTVYSFVRELLAAHERCAAISDGRTAADGPQASLTLAEAALRYGPLSHADRPTQVAVIGPTQTGKSTITNLLVAAPAAQVSPLAGFTVHPQGFRLCPDASDETWIAGLFGGRGRTAPHDLRREELDAWSLQNVPASPPASGGLFDESRGLGDCVVWDTPDFDSLAAQSYRRGLFEVLGLADAYVFVLSKEKYADLAAWRILRLVARLRRPIVICVNKLAAEHQGLIESSLRDRIAEAGDLAATVRVVSLRVHVTGENGIPPGAADAQELLAAVAPLVSRDCDATRCAGADVIEFIRAHWDEWTAPLRQEHAAADAWRELVRGALAGGVEAYRRDFLEHPQRYDSFRRASAALLAMLELPGVGAALGHVRAALTWPARQLWRAARELLAARADGRVARTANVEGQVLSDVLDDLLAALTRESARRADGRSAEAAFWKLLFRALADSQDGLKSTFAAAATDHARRVDVEIRAAADEMYESLRRRPALLNTLRAARATTDVAGVALAIKTGGTGVNDLIFAPAMLAFTSLLTEGALGTYVTRAAAKLKARQLESVQRDLLDAVVAPALQRAAENLRGEGVMGLSRGELAAADAALALIAEGCA